MILSRFVALSVSLTRKVSLLQLGKLGFFRQSREIPLIIRDPRPSADGGRGQRVEACTEHIDIAPTLIEAMGGVVPPVSSLCNCAERSAGFGRSGSDAVVVGRRWTAARCCRSCSTARSRRSTVGAQHRTTNTTSAPSPRPTSRRRSASGDHDRLHASSLAGLRLSHRWCPRFAECGLSVLHGFRHNGVRFNFVYFTAKDLPPLLYDVSNDPAESVDLAQNAEYAEVVLLCTTELLSHRMAHAECAAATSNPP